MRCGVLLIGVALLTSCVVTSGRGSPSGGSQPPPPPPPPPAHGVPPPAPAPGPAAPPPATGGSIPSLGEPDPAPPAPEPDEPPAAPVPVPPQPPLQEPPESRVPLTRLPPGVGFGRPKAFKPDAGTAYWIWQNAQGVWRMRTTSSGTHTFGGRAASLTGNIGGVRPSRTEFVDRIVRRHNQLYFKYATKGGVDGMDFNTRPDSCVRFQLGIDAGGAAGRIYVGAEGVQPATDNFMVCPK